MDATALYKMNSDINMFSGGGVVTFKFSGEIFSGSGNSFTRNRSSTFIVTRDRFRIIRINTELTTL